MRASAPGKLVLSGAYAVLEGAPALVAAVDRHALADTAQPAPLITEEVAAAIAAGHLERAPFFDSSALRQDGRKLGLGSSAAVLVASIAAAWLERGVADDALAERIFPVALEAHRRAQGGGSGIDVAAACYGGVLRCQLAAGGLEVSEHLLPAGLHVAVYACAGSAQTARMLESVRALARRDPTAYRASIEEASAGARQACSAATVKAFVEALVRQRVALGELGRHAAVPIVTPELVVLDAAARHEGAAVVPSGAGGGDVALFYGAAPPSRGFAALAAAKGLSPLEVHVGARGVHRSTP